MASNERRCTKCRRAINGHPGRYGPSCINVPVEDNTIASNADVSIQIDTPRDTAVGAFVFSTGSEASCESTQPSQIQPVVSATGSQASGGH